MLRTWSVQSSLELMSTPRSRIVGASIRYVGKAASKKTGGGACLLEEREMVVVWVLDGLRSASVIGLTLVLESESTHSRDD